MPRTHELIYHDAIGYSINDSPLIGSATALRRRKEMLTSAFSLAWDCLTQRICWKEKANGFAMSKFGAWTKQKHSALAKLIATTWKEAPQLVAKIHAGMKKSKAK